MDKWHHYVITWLLLVKQHFACLLMMLFSLFQSLGLFCFFVSL